MKNLLDVYLELNKNEKKSLIITTLLWSFWSLLGIVIIVLVVLMVGEIITPGYQRTTIYYYWGAIAGIFILKGISFSTANHVAHMTGFALISRLRNQFISRLKLFSLGFFTKGRLGDISTIAHQDIARIELLVIHLWTKLVSDILVSLTIALGLFILDWRLGLALVSLLPFAFIAFWYGNVKGVKAQTENSNNMLAMASSFVEYTKGIPALKAFSENPVIFKKLQEKITAFGNSSRKSALIAFKHIGGYFFFMELCLGIMVAAGAYLIIGNAISLQTYVVFIILGREFYKPLGNAEAYLVYYILTKDSYNRLSTVMQNPVIPEPANPVLPKKHDIHFDTVSFNYEKDGFSFQNIDFKIKENTITALVGPSGSGKTTIANLLVRFWDVGKGAIKVGGVDIRDIAYDELLAKIAIVMQNVILFDDTIYENIRVGKRNATKEEIIQAAQKAMIHDFIISLPKGYETQVGEAASKLSGGEKQRISIARMILKDAPIIILDETTSAVDPINERQIQQAISNLARNKTLLVIAHHLQTIRYADQIIVLEAGQIVEKGKHDALLAQDSTYKRLWEAQHLAKGWKVVS